MGFWNEGGFFRSVKGHLFKWWQLTIMPILKINNNRVNQQKGVSSHTKTVDTVSKDGHVAMESTTSQGVTDKVVPEESAIVADNESEQKKSTVSTENPMEVLKRINEEKEEKRRKEIEVARKKAQEQARIVAIMDANKVDVNAFIEAGKAAKQQEAEAKQEQEKKLNAEKESAENLRRSQEIMDRLNQEAAEDEAKKQAEIEAARQEAKKHFG